MPRQYFCVCSLDGHQRTTICVFFGWSEENEHEKQNLPLMQVFPIPPTFAMEQTSKALQTKFYKWRIRHPKGLRSFCSAKQRKYLVGRPSQNGRMPRVEIYIRSLPPNLQKIGVWGLNDYIGEVFFVNLNYSQFSTGPRDYEIEKIIRRWTNILNCIEGGRKQDIIVKDASGGAKVWTYCLTLRTLSLTQLEQEGTHGTCTMTERSVFVVLLLLLWLMVGCLFVP